MDLKAELKKLSEQSPNLAFGIDESPTNVINHSTTVVFVCKIIIVLAQGLFLMGLFFNVGLALRNNALENRIDELEIELTQKRGVEQQAVRLIQRIDNHKKLKSQTPIFSERIHSVIGALPSTITLNSVSFNVVSADIIAKAPEPLVISLLISTYLQQENVNEIALKGATLNRNDTNGRSYVVLMEVIYK